MARRSDHSRDELRALSLAAARQIVVEGGMDQLTARKVMDRIGYTIGTLYQVFRNMDDLVLQLNAETLEALYDAGKNAPMSESTRDRLLALALTFTDFVAANRNLWNLVSSYQYGSNFEWPENYLDAIRKTFELMETATAGLYSQTGVAKQNLELRVLWAGLHGIQALDQSQRLGRAQSVETMTKTLVDLFLAAKGQQEAT